MLSHVPRRRGIYRSSYSVTKHRYVYSMPLSILINNLRQVKVPFVYSSFLDGYANATWATGLASANFRLVCPFGPTRAITEFRQCHWGRIPTDKVVTTEDKDFVEREDLRLTLLKASQTFHTEQVLLRLFGPYYGIPNLLFKVLQILDVSQLVTDLTLFCFIIICSCIVGHIYRFGFP